MPTGYTHAVQTGECSTFEAFVWRCARAFGACVMQRDDPADAPVVEPTAQLGYYEKKRREAEAELTRLRAMTPAEAEQAAGAAYAARLADHTASIARTATERKRYETMRAAAEAWTPPTPDHVGLRDFMIQQLDESLRFDCSYEPDRPKLESGPEWLAQALKSAESTLTYANKYEAEERERTASRVAWIRALKSSVPQP